MLGASPLPPSPVNDLLSALLLGILEGLTEFLPVSSTGHLLIAEMLMGYHPPGEVLPIVIQFGAILAVVAVYWRKFWGVLVSLPTMYLLVHRVFAPIRQLVTATDRIAKHQLPKGRTDGEVDLG